MMLLLRSPTPFSDRQFPLRSNFFGFPRAWDKRRRIPFSSARAPILDSEPIVWHSPPGWAAYHSLAGRSTRMSRRGPGLAPDPSAPSGPAKSATY